MAIEELSVSEKVSVYSIWSWVGVVSPTYGLA